ncbi:MAG: hypothetical protein ACOY40_15115 [Bacillota bacterium]
MLTKNKNLLILAVLVICYFAPPGAAVRSAVYEVYRGSNINTILEAAKNGFIGKECVSGQDIINIAAQRGVPLAQFIQKKIFPADIKTTQKIQTIAPKAVPPEGHPPYYKRDALASVRIEGTKEFNDEIIKALKLLKERAPEHYQRVGNYVSSIEYAPKTDPRNIIAYVNPSKTENRVFFISLAPKDKYKIYRYVSAITHESRHLEQFYSLPEIFRDMSLVEHDAVSIEIDALKKVGAPQIFIDASIDTLKDRWWETNLDFDSPPPN